MIKELRLRRVGRPVTVIMRSSKAKAIYISTTGVLPAAKMVSISAVMKRKRACRAWLCERCGYNMELCLHVAVGDERVS